MSVIESLFTTEFREDGSSSSITLAGYASRFLVEVEHLFGPRDRSFTLVGIVIDKTPDSPPQLWFPDSGIPPGDAEGRSRHVVIRLGSNALSDPVRARWQTAHECVHVLDPRNHRVDGGPTNWLEEGLATWYQNTRVPEAECRQDLYADAQALVEPFIEKLQLAVRRLRSECRLRIGDFTPDVLHNYCPELPRETAYKLCRPFGS